MAKKKKLVELPNQENLMMAEEQLLEQSQAQLNELTIDDEMDLMLDYDLKEDEDSDWTPGTSQFTQVAMETESQVEIEDEMKLQEEK